MSLVSILLVLLFIALIGFIVHLIVDNITMPAAFKEVIIVTCVVLIVLYLISLVAGKAPLPVLFRG